MPKYADPLYWEKRYQKEKGKTFEWLHGFDNIKLELLASLQKSVNPKILNIGCGNSTMTEELYDLGYHDITNIDISETCIASMVQRNKEKRPNMAFEVIKIISMINRL